MGGMDSNAVVILVMFAVFSPVASKIYSSLVMLLLIAQLVCALLLFYFSNIVAVRL